MESEEAKIEKDVEQKGEPEVSSPLPSVVAEEFLSSAVSQLLRSLRLKRKKILNSLHQPYLADGSFNPRLLFVKPPKTLYEQLTGPNSPRFSDYSAAVQELEGFVVGNIQAAATDAVHASENLDMHESIIEQLSRADTVLPHNWWALVSEHVSSAKEEFKRRKAEAEGTLSGQKRLADVPELLIRLESACRSKDSAMIRHCEAALQGLIRKDIEHLTAELKQNQLLSVLREGPEAWSRWQQYFSKLHDLRTSSSHSISQTTFFPGFSFGHKEYRPGPDLQSLAAFNNFQGSLRRAVRELIISSRNMAVMPVENLANYAPCFIQLVTLLYPAHLQSTEASEKALVSQASSTTAQQENNESKASEPAAEKRGLLQRLFGSKEKAAPKPVNTSAKESPHYPPTLNMASFTSPSNSTFVEYLVQLCTLEEALMGLRKAHSATSSLMQEFHDSLNDGKVGELASILSTAKNAGKIFNLMREYFDSELCAKFTPELLQEDVQLLDYGDMVKEVMGRIQSCKSECSVPTLRCELTATRNRQDKVAFFHGIAKSMKFVIDGSKTLGAHVQVVGSDMVLGHIQSLVSQEIEQPLEDLLRGGVWQSGAIMNEFNALYDNLGAMEAAFEGISVIVQSANRTKTRVWRALHQQIQEKQASIVAATTLKEMVDGLILLKSLSLNVDVARQLTDRAIDESLRQLRDVHKGDILTRMAMQFEQHWNTEISQRLLNEHNAFKSHALAERNRRTVGYDIKQVLDTLKGDKIGTRALRDCYNGFEQRYRARVHEGLRHSKDMLGRWLDTVAPLRGQSQGIGTYHTRHR